MDLHKHDVLNQFYIFETWKIQTFYYEKFKGDTVLQWPPSCVHTLGSASDIWLYLRFTHLFIHLFCSFFSIFMMHFRVSSRKLTVFPLNITYSPVFTGFSFEVMHMSWVYHSVSSDHCIHPTPTKRRRWPTESTLGLLSGCSLLPFPKGNCYSEFFLIY